jgi:hypothetical protein
MIAGPIRCKYGLEEVPDYTSRRRCGSCRHRKVTGKADPRLDNSTPVAIPKRPSTALSCDGMSNLG